MGKKFVSIADVPLMRVGRWNASTGKEPITRAELDAMVDAFNSGDFDPAPLKLGHVDPRFNLGPEYDGNPAYGRVTNLRVTDDRGGTLIGDYDLVPEDLAESMDSAYPYRSIEMARDVEMVDVDGKVIATYPAVLVGCALLGETPPAVKGLGPVKANLSDSARPAIVQFFSMGQFSLQGGLTTQQIRQALQAAMSPPGGFDEMGTSNTWVEDFDDTLVWYHRDGRMWQSTYAINADGVATTSNETEVRERRIFEPVGDTIATRPEFPQQFTESNEPDQDGPAGAPITEPKESETMALTDNQLAGARKLLGLPDGATDADVTAAFEAALVDAPATTPDAHENPGTGNPPAGTTPGDGTGTQPAPAGVTVPPVPATAPTLVAASEAQAQEPTSSVTMSAAAFAEFKANADATAQRLKVIEDERDKNRRDGIIRQAFSEGRLHRTEIQDWRGALDTNEDVTVGLLNKRAPLFPTAEIGHDVAPAAFSLGPVAIADKELAADDALFGIPADNTNGAS